MRNCGFRQFVPLLFLFLLSPAAWCDKIRIDLSAGAAEVSNASYDAGAAGMAGISFNFNSFIVGGGILKIVELRPDNQDSNSEITVDGVYLGLAKALDLQVLSLEIGGGAVYGETEVEFQGRDIGSDDDLRPYLGVKIIKGFGPVFSLQGGWQYIDDLSGGDLHLFQAGVRLAF